MTTKHRARPLLTACAAVTLATGCGPVQVKAAWGQPMEGNHLADLAVINIHDLRGQQVDASLSTSVIDMPDRIETTANSYGGTTYATSTYYNNDVEVAAGQYMGTDEVQAVRYELAKFLREGGAGAAPALIDPNTVVSYDDHGFARLAHDERVNYVAIVEVSDYQMSTDAGRDSLAWAYVGAGTLGLAAPFIPLERWNARTVFTGNVYIWKDGEGLVARQPLNLKFSARGPGVPGYKRVASGVGKWADSKIAEAVQQALVEGCRRAGCVAQ